MPQFLGDERHERVQHDEDLVERPSGDGAGFGGGGFARALGEHRLDQFQIPVAEPVPHEVVDCVRCCIEAQLGHRRVERIDRLLDFADDPLVGGEAGLRRGNGVRRTNPVRLAEPGRVPQLGGEVAVSLDPLLIHLDVAALAFHRRHEEPQRIGAEPVDQAQWVDHVALGLGHLLPVRRAHQPVEVELVPRALAHVEIARHQHPRIPEEQDVETGDEQRVGVVLVQQVGPLRPAERGERPQGGGEPGIEDVFVAGQHYAFAGLRLRLFLRHSDIAFAVVTIPGGYPVPPP